MAQAGIKVACAIAAQQRKSSVQPWQKTKPNYVNSEAQ
jgi:hypothetical protein